jgi:hypothetical protein
MNIRTKLKQWVTNFLKDDQPRFQPHNLRTDPPPWPDSIIRFLSEERHRIVADFKARGVTLYPYEATMIYEQLCIEARRCNHHDFREKMHQVMNEWMQAKGVTSPEFQRFDPCI